MIATAHAVGALLVGLYFAATDALPFRMLCACAYIIGSEVLWRMSGAGVFWEYGKYAIVLLCILGILKWRPRASALPLLYFAFLLPSTVTYVIVGGSSWRSDVSFNMSGPLALAASALLLSRTRMSRADLEGLLLAAVVPLSATAVLVLAHTLGAGRIVFSSTNSSFAASGGFGPNQVSAVLGLGALCCWLYVLTSRPSPGFRWLILALGLGLLAEAALTFSRGGVLNFVVAAVISLPFLIRGTGRARSGVLAVMLSLVLLYVFLPRLNHFTGGFLSTRYSSSDVTGRDVIAKNELEVWRSHFLTGVGPGRSRSFVVGNLEAAHTEYTRVLAEHGLFGAFSLLMLVVMAARAFLRARSAYAKGIVLALVAWSMVEMAHSATRLGAISLVFALGQLDLAEDSG
jgi:O-antigen ligase